MNRPNKLTLEEAQILKELALADLHWQEAEDLKKAQELKEAETRYKDAETRFKLAEAKYAEHNAEAMRISADIARRHEVELLADDRLHHVYEFREEFDAKSVAECSFQLANWHRADPTCDMTIKIHSPGGNQFNGMDLFDELSAYSLREWDTREIPKGTHKTTMVVRGVAASMAGILLQAADKRIMGPEAAILIHQGSAGVIGSMGEIEDITKYYDQSADRIIDIFMRRAGEKITKPAFKRGWNRREWWMTSEEALKHGFVDEIG